MELYFRNPQYAFMAWFSGKKKEAQGTTFDELGWFG
jgi:hypothetical protein